MRGSPEPEEAPGEAPDDGDASSSWTEGPKGLFAEFVFAAVVCGGAGALLVGVRAHPIITAIALMGLLAGATYFLYRQLRREQPSASMRALVLEAAGSALFIGVLAGGAIFFFWLYYCADEC